MNTFLQAAALVSDAPGSLVYHLVLLFALGAAAAVALGQWQFVAPQSGFRTPAPARLAMAAGLLFALRLLGMVLAFLAALAVVNPLVAVPPFERAASTLTILAVIWLLNFPEPQRLADATFSLLALLVGLALVISWAAWALQAAAARFYNGTPQETAWEAAQILLLVAGAILLARRRRDDWGLGLAILGLLLAGHVIHYSLTIAQSNVSGIERLFEIVVVPLLAAVIFRRALRSKPAVPAPVLEPASQSDVAPTELLALPVLPAAEHSPAIPPLDLQAALASASHGNAPELATLEQSMTAGIARALQAPLVVLLTPAPDGAQFAVTCAYELAQQKFVSVMCTVLDNHPELVEALDRNESVVWQPGESEADLRATIFAAGPEMVGPVLLVPLPAGDGRPLAVVGALHTSRQSTWSAEQQAWLKAMAEPMAVAWRAVADRAAAELMPARVEAERDAARQEAEHLRRQGQVQAEQLQRLEQGEAVHADQLGELETLRSHLQALVPEIDRWRQRQQELETQFEQQRHQEAELRAQLERLSASAAVPLTTAVALQPTPEGEALFAKLQVLQPQLDYYRGREEKLQAEVEKLRAELAARPAPSAAPALDTEQSGNLQLPAAEIDTYRAEQQLQQSEIDRLRQESSRLQTELDQARAQPDHAQELEHWRGSAQALEVQVIES